jgi:lipid-A-disaccharide synthase
MSRTAAGPRILVLSGEASGDRLGAHLVSAIRERLPDAQFDGIGGEAMERAGVRRIYDSGRIAVTGIVEVLGALRSIWSAWRAARRQLHSARPDLVILVDYPDFNLRFARVARRAAVPVVYFVSPQVWAWRQRRVRRIARDVDRMLVLFPFETRFYEDAGVPVEFVGHPLVDLVPPPGDAAAAAAELGLDPEAPVLGLLPGSRRSEVALLLPVMLEAAARLAESRPELQCVLPLAGGLDRHTVDRHLAASPLDVHVVPDRFHTTLTACRAALVASGTATLETALLQIPMVITYKLSPWTYRLARRMFRLSEVGLPNLILGRRAVPECIQDQCEAGTIASHAAALLKDGPERLRQVQALGEVRQQLGAGGAFGRAADAVVRVLQGDLDGARRRR